MKLINVMVFKLHCLGIYGSHGISINDLKDGLKIDYNPQEFEDVIIDLFTRGIIIINNSSGYPCVSLDPKMKEDIYKIIKWNRQC